MNYLHLKTFVLYLLINIQVNKEIKNDFLALFQRIPAPFFFQCPLTLDVDRMCSIVKMTYVTVLQICLKDRIY